MSDNKAEAGWYPDPHNASQQRYYDGEQWTDHYAPAAGAAPAESWDSPLAGTSTGTTVGFSDIGTLMGAAWAALTKRIGSLIGLTVITAVIGGILVAIAAAVIVGANSGGVAILVALVVALLFIAIYAAYQLIIARIFLAEHKGTSLSISDAWDQTKSQVLPFVGTLIVVAIVGLIGFIIAVAILGAIHPVLLILVLPAIVFIWVKLAFLPTAAAAREDASIFEGSTNVSSGRFWPVLLRLIALAAVAIIWSLIMQFVTAAVSDNTALLVIVSIISMIGSFLTTMFIAAGTSKVFLESGARTDVPVGRG